jgi:hypothetical protein
MKKIKHLILFVLLLATLAITPAGCGSKADIIAELGQQFSLYFGQMAEIKGEKLEMTFVEILEDNRCPSDVTCIWEGRVRCRLDVSYKGTSYEVILSQPGLSYNYVSGFFKDYSLTFKIEPYPVSDVTLSASDYHIYLTVS